jgi:cell division protein FtsI/penicillin-binding protein 2
MSPSFDRRALSPFDPLSRNRRAHLARLTILVGLVVLTGGFFRLQVVQYAAHEAQSTSNQVRSIPLAAPRGFMFDRDGEIIAENLPAYSVSLMPSSERDLRADMESLRPILGLDDEDIAELERQYELAPGQRSCWTTRSTTARCRCSRRSATRFPGSCCSPSRVASTLTDAPPPT